MTTAIHVQRCRHILLALAACLLALGADMRAQPSPATLGLQKSVQSNRTADAQRHLAAGADVGALDEANRPPLYWAVLFGNDRLVAALLKRGADPRWTGPDRATLLHDAVRWPILEPAAGHPPAGEPPSLAGKRRIVERLLQARLTPNAVDSNGSTPLHIATGLPLGTSEPLAIVRLLLSAGAQPLAANAYGLTPLDLARRRGATDLVAALGKKK